MPTPPHSSRFWNAAVRAFSLRSSPLNSFVSVAGFCCHLLTNCLLFFLFSSSDSHTHTLTHTHTHTDSEACCVQTYDTCSASSSASSPQKSFHRRSSCQPFVKSIPDLRKGQTLLVFQKKQTAPFARLLLPGTPPSVCRFPHGSGTLHVVPSV